METSQEKRCWICLSEELEDSDNWVAPCYCKGSVKYTHEKCLLRWIFEKQQDLDPVSCQSCGYAYVIQEPYNPALSVMNSINASINTLVPYGFIFLSSIGGYICTLFYGGYALLTIAGDEVMDVITDESLEFQVIAGLPLIPISLILSRFNVPDTFFIIMPMLLFPVRRFPLKLSWPPSPILTLYTVPWIRLFYKRLKESIVKWDFERERLKNAGTFQIATIEEEESQSRSFLRISLGALAFPALSSFVGSILGLIPFVKRNFPSRFHRSILGGFVTVFLKDVTSFIYRKIIRYQRRQRRIKNYHSD